MSSQSQVHNESTLLSSPGRFTRLNFRYMPLRDSELRLLKLPPPSTFDDMNFKIEHFRWDSKFRCIQPYSALSYCWGDVSDMVEIFLNSRRLLIIRSLEGTLRELTQRGYDYVWIDAICINQSDKNEMVTRF
ncbi:heterokaryon incompatibility protein-domain-containing protein [Rhexocercosporidium sp. MPI-PUGE-AT-0058]|nr:heterokaryon incompatibility protein-domain-containing protein [Rhexocercosporidium sp. MPI-PUGE-AT-0058]